MGRVSGGFAPQPKNQEVWGAAPPSQKRNVIKKPFLEKALSRKAVNSMLVLRNFKKQGLVRAERLDGAIL